MKKIPNELVDAICTGKAVLFTGAGFSRECESIDSKMILAAKDLSAAICNLGKFDKSDNLMYSSERYISADDGNKAILVDFLKKNYTAKKNAPYIEKISSFKWKDIYTTNYDNTIELSGRSIGKNIFAIDMEYPLDDVNKIKNKCIHINGYIETLTEDNLNKAFKLSDSSYCNADGFLNSPWYTMFKRSIERCSALIFVGYSLYDLDVKRVLASIDGLRERTYFIASPDCKDEDLFTIGQFGRVHTCGVESFSAQLPDPASIIYPSMSLSSLIMYSQSTEDYELKDADVDSLLLYGNYNQTLIEESVFENKSSEYVVLREPIVKIERMITESNIVITSELGNGKTIFLQEIMASLSRSNTVYYVYDYFSDIISDLESLTEAGEKCIVVIDDYNKAIEIFDCYHLYDKDRIKFLISARSSVHETYRELLKNSKFSYKETAIDIFSGEESTNLINLIDSVGLWGSINSRGFKKNDFFPIDCNSQISSLLVALLNSPDIKSRIKKVFEGLFASKDVDIKKISIASAFLCIQSIRTDTALISEVAGNGIYDSRLRTNSSFCELFKFEHDKIKAKSTIFCQSFIQNYFEPEYTMSFLLGIAESFDSKKK